MTIDHIVIYLEVVDLWKDVVVELLALLPLPLSARHQRAQVHGAVAVALRQHGGGAREAGVHHPKHNQ